MDNNIWVKSSANLAKRLHEGQVDKSGVDYFEGHLCMVASMGRTWKEQVVGYLHDASEDTPHTTEEVLSLLEEDAKDRLELATALHLLNHHSFSRREDYIQAIGQNSLARAVKLNDLQHNMDLSRLSSPSQKDFNRRDRYEREYNYLYSITSH